MRLRRGWVPVCFLLSSACADAEPAARAVEAAPSAPADPEGWYPHEGSLLRYRVQIRFGEELADKSASGAMPPGWKLGRVSAVATDSEGDVYVLHRGQEADPILVFDAEGRRLLRSWGKGLFTRGHAIRIDRDDAVWVTDVRDHRVFKFSKEGDLLLELGVKDEPGDDPERFNRPADVAFGPDGDVWIAEQGEDEESPGLGEPRVTRLTADGRFVARWGRPGTGPGEFHFPHSVAVDSRGTVYVSDRENDRVQIFDAEGVYQREWGHLGTTLSLFVTPADELWMLNHRNAVEILTYDNLAGRIMRVDRETGRILGSLETPGHWLDVSRTGDLYVGSLTGNVFRFYPGWMDGEGNR